MGQEPLSDWFAAAYPASCSRRRALDLDARPPEWCRGSVSGTRAAVKLDGSAGEFLRGLGEEVTAELEQLGCGPP